MSRLEISWDKDERTLDLLCFQAILSKSCLILLFPTRKRKEEKNWFHIQAHLKNDAE